MQHQLYRPNFSRRIEWHYFQSDPSNLSSPKIAPKWCDKPKKRVPFLKKAYTFWKKADTTRGISLPGTHLRDRRLGVRGRQNKCHQRVFQLSGNDFYFWICYNRFGWSKVMSHLWWNFDSELLIFRCKFLHYVGCCVSSALYIGKLSDLGQIFITNYT